MWKDPANRLSARFAPPIYFFNGQKFLSLIKSALLLKLDWEAELRAVNRIEQRISEAEKLGFRKNLCLPSSVKNRWT